MIVPMKEKYVDEAVGVFIEFGRSVEGQVDVTSSGSTRTGDVEVFTLPPDAAFAVVHAQKIFRMMLYQILCEGAPMVIWCVKCGAQHHDDLEWRAKPHKTHLCEACGHEWRPFDYPTIGVCHDEIDLDAQIEWLKLVRGNYKRRKLFAEADAIRRWLDECGAPPDPKPEGIRPLGR